MMLLGYYSLMPNLEPDLPEVFAAIRADRLPHGAGRGRRRRQRCSRWIAILPHLDVYVPSHDEATHQTGETDPRKIIDTYRDCGAPGLLGVKLGVEGALLSPAAGEYIDIACVAAARPRGRYDRRRRQLLRRAADGPAEVA